MTELLTLDELAVFLRTTPDAIYAARYRGDPLPPAIKIGRRVLFRKSTVEQWLDESTEQQHDGTGL